MVNRSPPLDDRLNSFEYHGVKISLNPVTLKSRSILSPVMSFSPLALRFFRVLPCLGLILVALLTFSARAAQVSLAWNDNSTDETGFKIERADATGSFVQIGTVAANVTTYVDATAAAGSVYLYRVGAYNDAGVSAYSNVLTLTAAPNSSPVIVTQPRSASLSIGTSTVLTVDASGTPSPVSQWRKNGVDISGATGSSLTLTNFQIADAGAYTVVLTNAAGSLESQAATIGVASTAKMAGGASLVGVNIAHANGNIYDQVLLTGASAVVTADPGKVTRLSFIDLNDDIVQVEFSGAGTLAINLAGASGPAFPANYNQATSYMKGHASIVVSGANVTSNLSVFSVGRTTAVNQALFRSDVTYDGVADIASIAISSTDGKFGGVRTANASYWATTGLTGIDAPNVQFTGPVYVGDINASGTAAPLLLLGGSGDVRITGGDLLQTNARPVQVSGLTQLQFTAGTTSQGTVLPVQTNRGRLEQNGSDVTAQIVGTAKP